jgi:general secretion pathway protein K
MGYNAFRRTRQRGVAVVTALLLTTLAVTIVASLFWQQQVQVRSIENQRLQLQKQWILRGALDWARLILRENARLSQNDTLDQPWAVPLQDTRLDQYVENDRTDTEASTATLSGQMVDAQSMVNLNNLAANGVPVPKEVKVFARLLGNLRLNPSLAQEAAVMIAASTAKQNLGGTPVSPAAPPAPTLDPTTGLPRVQGGTDSPAQMQPPAVVVPSGPPMLAMTQVEDLLAVPGFTPEAVEKLRNLVIFLPQAGTQVNINTASTEVLAAVIEGISTSDAAVIVATRTSASFRNSGDFALRLPGVPAVGSSNLGVASDYFLVNGKVRLSRAALQIQALIKRSGRGQSPKTQVIWTREN